MKCSECYWCALSHTLSEEVVCCNEESEYYNKIFSKEEIKKMECEKGETKMEFDYKHMTAWEFASRYYM